MDMKDKVVIVTGASSGIGAATAVAFSCQGAKVVMVGRNEAKLTKVAAKCSKSFVILADLANDLDVKRIVDETIKKFGKIDVLVNNAGLSRTASILDSNIMETFNTIMNVNVRGLIHMTSLSAPHLAKTKGNIVNISSVAAFITPVAPGMTNYSISKAAVSHFSRCAAAEFGQLGIRVNTVSPGPVITDFLENANMNNISWEEVAKKTCLNRVSEPEEIADLIVFLASDKAKGITGSEFLSDNGIFVKRE